MPRSAFGRKDEEQQLPSNLATDTAITDKDDLEEIKLRTIIRNVSLLDGYK